MTSPTGRTEAEDHQPPEQLPGQPAARRLARLRRVTHALTSTVTLTVTVGTAASLLLFGAPGSVERLDTERDTAVGRSAQPAEPVEVQTRLVALRGRPWPGHPGRRLVPYRVRRGDTATELAVRFHAWTDELRSLNHLGRSGTLYVGRRIRIPVVLAAVRRHHVRHPHPRAHPHGVRKVHKPRKPRAHAKPHAKPRPKPRPKPAARPHRPSRPWRHADASRAKVRRVIVRAAHRYGVDPYLALAIGWQESGWQQRRISSAHAIGAMQLIPDTGRWMSMYFGRRLNLYGLYDNVAAGVVVIKVLQTQTGPKWAIGSYYQGLGAVLEHGMYPSTKRYVRNVLALRKRLAQGWNPA